MEDRMHIEYDRTNSERPTAGRTSAGAIVRSAAAGIVGAMTMTAMRVVSTKLGIVKQVPPESLLKQGTPALLRRVPKKHRRVAIELAHWSYGAMGGAVFRLLPQGVRQHLWAGPAYGVGLWTILEAVLEPALGVRRPWGERGAESAALIADHVLYGLVVGAGERRPTTSAPS